MNLQQAIKRPRIPHSEARCLYMSEVPLSSFHGESGNVRTMNVTEWLDFLKAAAMRRRCDLGDVVRTVKEQIHSSNTLSREEKESIFRTINRAVETELFGADMGFTDDPQNPRITLSPPKVDGRYDDSGLFIDPYLSVRAMAVLRMLPFVAFLTCCFAVGIMLFHVGFPRMPLPVPFYIAIPIWALVVLEAFENRARYPAMRFDVLRCLFITVLFSAPFLWLISRNGVAPFSSGENIMDSVFDFLRASSLPLPLLGLYWLLSIICVVFSDFLWIQARLNNYERRTGIAVKLGLACPLCALLPGGLWMAWRAAVP
jgi:hypothetical protein